MKKTKHDTKKVTLGRDAVRTVSAKDLRVVAGGLDGECKKVQKIDV